MNISVQVFLLIIYLILGYSYSKIHKKLKNHKIQIILYPLLSILFIYILYRFNLSIIHPYFILNILIGLKCGCIKKDISNRSNVL
jgi:4-amino-4-deoxy-L-arabinose transferase-like glycosyltransferase